MTALSVKVILSVKREIEYLLENNGYSNIYGEAEAREVMAGQFEPTEPYVFITLGNMAPVTATLPFVVVHLEESMRRPIELGRRISHIYGFQVHTWGRNRLEVEEISSYIADGWPESIPVYNYGTDPDEEIGKLELDGEISVAPVLVNENIELEASLRLWKVITFPFRTLL